MRKRMTQISNMGRREVRFAFIIYQPILKAPLSRYLFLFLLLLLFLFSLSSIR